MFHIYPDTNEVAYHLTNFINNQNIAPELQAIYSRGEVSITAPVGFTVAHIQRIVSAFSDDFLSYGAPEQIYEAINLAENLAEHMGPKDLDQPENEQQSADTDEAADSISAISATPAATLLELLQAGCRIDFGNEWYVSGDLADKYIDFGHTLYGHQGRYDLSLAGLEGTIDDINVMIDRENRQNASR